MSEYEGKKRGICPFSEVDTFIKNNDCGMFQFCDCCDDYFRGYDKGRADAIKEFLGLIEARITERNRGLYLIEAIDFAEQLKGAGNAKDN